MKAKHTTSTVVPLPCDPTWLYKMLLEVPVIPRQVGG